MLREIISRFTDAKHFSFGGKNGSLTQMRLIVRSSLLKPRTDTKDSFHNNFRRRSALWLCTGEGHSSVSIWKVRQYMAPPIRKRNYSYQALHGSWSISEDKSTSPLWSLARTLPEVGGPERAFCTMDFTTTVTDFKHSKCCWK